MALSPHAPVWRPRAERDLVVDQVTAVDAWNRARRARDEAIEALRAGERSREMRMDAARRVDVLRRQQQALLQRTAQQLSDSACLLQAPARTRAVVAHRSRWFQSALTQQLAARGVRVVAATANGADAVGIVVAEQPDLLLVEERLEMMPGAEVLREVLGYAPRLIAAAQVEYQDGVAPLLEAGARAAFTRRVPPADVAAELSRLVSA